MRTRATAGAPMTTPRGAPPTGTTATAATVTGTVSVRAIGATRAGAMLTETGSVTENTWAGGSMTRGRGNALLRVMTTAAAGRSVAVRRARQSGWRAARKSLPAGRSACAMTAPH